MRSRTTHGKGGAKALGPGQGAGYGGTEAECGAGGLTAEMTLVARAALVCLLLSTAIEAVWAGTWDDLMAAAQSAHQREAYETAQGHLEAALRIAESFAEDDTRLATTLFALGSVYFDLERFEQAGDPLERAIAVEERSAGSTQTRLAAMLNALGLVHTRLGDYGQAEPLYRRAAAIFEAANGADHLSVAQVLKNLGGIRLDEGRYGEAEAIYRRVIPVLERGLGARDPELAVSLQHYALTLRNLGHETEADALDARAAEILNQ